MAFRKKWPSILKYNPDILVVQECELKDKILASENFPKHEDFIWFGENKNKGIGIISFNGIRIKRSPYHNEDFKFILPVDILNFGSLKLFVIWAMPSKEGNKASYIGQVWKSLNHYDLSEGNAILIGDWNSNAIWDKERRVGNHTQSIDLLSKFRIFSLYHTLRNEAPGNETEPTLFLLKKQDKPYHLDYCFASESLICNATEIKIGKYSDWIKQSDHMPLIIDNLNTERIRIG